MTAPLNIEGKKGLIVGIANDQSIAYGCAPIFHDAGADLAITYLDVKPEKYIRPLAEILSTSLILPCNSTMIKPEH